MISQAAELFAVGPRRCQCLLGPLGDHPPLVLGQNGVEVQHDRTQEKLTAADAAISDQFVGVFAGLLDRRETLGCSVCRNRTIKRAALRPELAIARACRALAGDK